MGLSEYRQQGRGVSKASRVDLPAIKTNFADVIGVTKTVDNPYSRSYKSPAGRARNRSLSASASANHFRGASQPAN